MPAAKPSRSAVSNVIAALEEAGLTAKSVHVDSSGGFTVQIARDGTVAQQDGMGQSEPRKFGVVR